MPKKLTPKQREERAAAKLNAQLQQISAAFYKQMDKVHKSSNAAAHKIHVRKTKKEQELEERFRKRRDRALDAYAKVLGKKSK